MALITPIANDRTLGGNGKRQFDIISGATVIASNADIIMTTPIEKEGTRVNSAYLNNIINFDNLIAFQGCEYHLIGDTPDSTLIKESIKVTETGQTVAARTHTKISDNKISVVEIIYDINIFDQLIEKLHREGVVEKKDDGTIECVEGTANVNAYPIMKMLGLLVQFANEAEAKEGIIDDKSISPNTLKAVLNILLPKGIISMWSGTIATIPAGWVLCNGQNGTPDLRNRFIVGAGSTYSPGNVGGSDSVALIMGQMPPHAHHSDVAGTAQAGAAGGNNFNVLVWDATFTQRPTSTEGYGAAHENRPPYYALAYIMKL